MANGDPISQEKFYDTMNSTKKDILDAVEKVNGHVQDTRVDVAKINTNLDTHEARMNSQDKRIDNQDDKIGSQKAWNRGLAAVEGLLVAIMVALGIRGQQ